MSPAPRPIEAADTEALQRLIAACYAEYDLVLDLEGIDAHLLSPGPTFRGAGGECWVLEAPGEGGALLAVVAAKLISAEASELKSLYVHPSLRRQGWGSRLSRRVEVYALNAGRRRVELWSDTRFEGAHHLYRGLGYTQRGERALGDVQDTREYGFFRELLPPGQGWRRKTDPL